MKKIIVLFLMLVLSGSIAYADFFDWITGKATEGTELIKEEVKCVFINATSEQKCYTDDNKFGCSGIGTCIAGVSGENGSSLRWKSSCGGEVYTTIDSSGESIEFKCEPTATPTPIPAAEIIKEQVNCNFLNSNSEQKCYTSDGKFVCSGTGSCIADVSGERGKKLEWKSSCSGYPYYTSIDGINENAEFKCELPAISPCGNGACESGETCSSCPSDCGQCATPDVKDQVKCAFLNSNTTQKCYTSDGKFACSGTGSCLADAYGAMGAKLEWKSSCSGYPAYTFIDGKDDYAEFKCAQEPATATPVPTPAETPKETVPENIYEEAICVFHNSKTAQQCSGQDGKFSCSGTDKCITKVYGQKGQTIQWKSTCQKPEFPPYIVIDGASEQVWFNCESAVPAASPAPIAPSPTPITEYITEQVKCTFIDPDPMLKHSCGASGGSCTWIWDGIKTEARDERMGPLFEKEINGKQVKYASCTAEAIGENGEKKTWRSTCGGETNTITDGVNEEVEFSCLSDRQVNIEQISGKGFRNAFWYCQGGAGRGLGNEETCKTAGAWKKLAEEYCANSCHKTVVGQEKCGLYSFSVSKECYFATAAEREAAQEMPVTGEELKMREAAPLKMFTHVLIYSYLSDCAECAELEASSANKMPLKIEDRAKTTDFRYGNFNYKQFLDKYPNENVLLSLEIMSEVQEGKARAYAKVYERPGQVDSKTAEDWWRNQVLTKAIKPVYDTLSDKIITAPEIKTDFLVYYYSGDCPECEKLKNIQADIGDKEVVVSTESSGTTSMSLALVAALKPFLEKHKDENYLIYGMYSGDNELSLYAKAGKADYEATADWIRQIRAGKLSPTGVVGKTEAEVKKQIGQQTEKQKPAEEVIICKDSCPLDEKCYPFGYRKGGKYCSDEGMFKGQLKADEFCENNFECSTNVCVDGKCVSSGLIQKITNWFKNLFVLLGKEEAKEEITESVDCGENSECMENAFKVCKPAKISQQQGGSVSEIVGLEGEKCVVKMTAGTESMTCKFENYALGTKNLGSTPEKYCEGTLVKKLAQPSVRGPSAPATKPSTEIQPPQAKQENIQEPTSPTLPQQKTPAPEQVTTPASSELSKEQVSCKFIDPDLVQRCYADFGKLGCSNIIRKCYTADEKFGCTWAGGVTSKPEGKGFIYTPDCVAEVYGEQGTKLTWKGSCGEYSYTVIDRSNEDATFMCMPSGSQIKGFLHANWKCENGVEEKSIEGVDLTTCKSSEIWNEYAKEYCKNQGGIKDFSVSKECSIAVQKEGVFIST